MHNPRAVSAVTQKLEGQVYEQAIAGRFALTLGGDHSIAIGTVAGTARAIRERLNKDIAVIWVDAHADINTPEMSCSGHVHGMPLAFLTGIAVEKDESMFGWLNKYTTATSPSSEHVDETGNVTTNGDKSSPLRGIISTKNLVYIGLRDVDRAEKVILRSHGIKAFSMHDIDKYDNTPLTLPSNFPINPQDIFHFLTLHP